MKKLTAPAMSNTFTVPVNLYDLVVYAGQSGLSPANGNLAGKDLAVLTISGTCNETKKRGVFIIQFFPTGSSLQQARYTLSNSAVQVNAEMDICQLGGMMAVLQSKPNCAAVYYEVQGSQSGQVGNSQARVTPFVEVTTTNGA